MIIVIDAYNLLHAIPSYNRMLSDRDRMRFIVALSRYGKAKNHSIVLVFDGGPYEWPFKESIHGVIVVSSGVHESADSYIKEYIEKHKSADVLLVSSDNDLNLYAQRRSIPSIDSVVFYGLLYNTIKGANTKSTAASIVKTSQDDTELIDDLMRKASIKVPTKSDDVAVNDICVTKKKRSKQDRILLKKLHKL